MKKRYAIVLVLVAVLIVVGLVACSQAQTQQEPQNLNAQQTTTVEPTVEPTIEPAQTVEPEQTTEPEQTPEPVETDQTETDTPEQEIMSDDELLELFQNVFNYFKGDRNSIEEEKIEAELKMIENSAKIAYRKALPADYKERYIDWRPIEGDPDDGLVDTGTTSGTGTGGTDQNYIDEFTQGLIDAGILNVVDPSEASPPRDLTDLQADWEAVEHAKQTVEIGG